MQKGMPGRSQRLTGILLELAGFDIQKGHELRHVGHHIDYNHHGWIWEEVGTSLAGCQEPELHLSNEVRACRVI